MKREREAAPALPRTAAERIRRLQAAVSARAEIDVGETDVVRLVNGAGDGLPGVVVDRYGRFGVLHLVTDEAVEAREQLLDAVATLDLDGVYLKAHPRTAREATPEERAEMAPSAPSRGAAAPTSLIVRERGLALIARLGDGLATGVYPDQRNSRTRLASLVEGKTLLNLFGYTGAFSVAAARAGARRTVTVDLSKSALAWAEENFRANDPSWDAKAHPLRAEDAIAYLAKARAKGSRFDAIVLDPPSFATHKGGRFSVEEDYTAAAAACVALLSPGGTLLAVTNHRKLSLAAVRAMVSSGARAAGREIVRLDVPPPPADFPVDPVTGEPTTKAVFLLAR